MLSQITAHRRAHVLSLRTQHDGNVEKTASVRLKRIQHHHAYTALSGRTPCATLSRFRSTPSRSRRRQHHGHLRPIYFHTSTADCCTERGWLYGQPKQAFRQREVRNPRPPFSSRGPKVTISLGCLTTLMFTKFGDLGFSPF